MAGTLTHAGSLCVLGALIEDGSLTTYGALSTFGSLYSDGALGLFGSLACRGALGSFGSLLGFGALGPFGSLGVSGALEPPGSLRWNGALSPFGSLARHGALETSGSLFVAGGAARQRPPRTQLERKAAPVFGACLLAENAGRKPGPSVSIAQVVEAHQTTFEPLPGDAIILPQKRSLVKRLFARARTLAARLVLQWLLLMGPHSELALPVGGNLRERTIVRC